MSDSPTPLPANPSLEQLRKRAKERVREWHAAGNPNATRANAQFAIAREQGFETWAQLKHRIESLRPPGIEAFEQLAASLAEAYTSGEERRVRHRRQFRSGLPDRLPRRGERAAADALLGCLAGSHAGTGDCGRTADGGARLRFRRSGEVRGWPEGAAGRSVPGAGVSQQPAAVPGAQASRQGDSRAESRSTGLQAVVFWKSCGGRPVRPACRPKRTAPAFQ